MSGMDVSMRLRLVNQLSKPANEAEKDLKELRAAAERLGQTKSGALSGNLDKIGKSATGAERDVKELRAAAERLGQTKNGALAGNLEKVGKSATEAKVRIGAIGREADELRQKLGTVGNGSFDGLKADAREAEQAINRVGAAASEMRQRLHSARGVAAGKGSGGPVRVPAGGGGSAGSVAGGILDQLNVPLALGTGAAYMSGGLAGVGVVGAGVAIDAAAADEQRSDFLRITGGYSEVDQKRIDALLAQIGARRGIGNQAAQTVFGGLQAGGLPSSEAASMTDNAVKFAIATESAPEAAANLTVALRQNMGIQSDQMPAAYDTVVMGGNAGKFEVKDMSRNFPAILSRLGARGSKGMEGVRMAAAFAQSVVERIGSPDETSTSLEAMLSDMVSPTVRERASKVGVDILGEKSAAEAKGKDPVMAILKRLRAAVGGDDKKFSDTLGGNDTAAVAYRAIFDDMEKIEKLMSEMENSKGVLDEKYEVGTGNLNFQKQRLLSNVSQRIKNTAAPALSPLTRIAKDASDALERGEDATNRQRTIDAIVGHLPKQPKAPEQDRPPAWKRLLFGSAAEPGFDLKRQLGIDLRPSAEAAMDGYNAGLTKGGEQAKSEAKSIADELRAILGITVTPTISPVIAPASPAPGTTSAPEKHSSLQQSSNVRLTQNIVSPNPKLAAIKARREQARAIEQARSRSFYDLGPRLA
ncbi:hypothetical protein ATN81_03100 [Agrobacterium pusense]|uniref:phage tail tape measure protein n=1 Tax=Agrobacterium pusense TaxID=648995 RepID=UPI000925DD0F|nr:phage tail tape measure protein [Agrobacterium pusense]OJH51169.1 hypothetical protein ATN81_03100 [Agrobacterium pusense]OJH56016.1 hypothetical protein BA725_03920 [Agrobacterium pusense]